MRSEVGEAGERLRMRLHVPAAGAATNRTARALDGLPERSHHFVAQPLHPCARESGLQAGNAILIKRIKARRELEFRSCCHVKSAAPVSRSQRRSSQDFLIQIAATVQNEGLPSLLG